MAEFSAVYITLGVDMATHVLNVFLLARDDQHGGAVPVLLSMIIQVILVSYTTSGQQCVGECGTGHQPASVLTTLNNVGHLLIYTT